MLKTLLALIAAASALAMPFAQKAPSPCAPIVDCTPIKTETVSWLKSFAGQPMRDAAQHSEFKHFVAAVAPDVTYHLGIDMPLTTAVGLLFAGTGPVVQVRDGRYALLSACRTPTCTGGRALLWVDLQAGLAVGGIEFNPTNGEPAPTLTLFSGQVGDRIGKRGQLPAAFLADLDPWLRGTRVRGTPVRYFVNAVGWKSLVIHDEDACQGADRSALALTLCASTNLDAAEQDMRAAAYLLINQYPDGSAPRDAVKADQDKWLIERGKLCVGAANDPGTVNCRLKLTRDRAQTLTDLYSKQSGK